ncbi:alpha/beta fold hydrolase [Ideonella sp. DXS29W]|uniref:Alpha/beta fold hydrolase n=1 Tax=Ideonella lacteola TaxID=2984193 RepID=A0ABU9BXD1_9BURK
MNTATLPLSATESGPSAPVGLRSRRLSLGTSSVHLIDEGEGAPVLFLHGNPDSSELWVPIIRAMGDGWRCLAPDLPGFGRSTASPGFDCSLDGMAAFVDELLRAAGIDEPVHLVVHDIGGPFGLAWAVKHPHQVRSLFITNTVFTAEYRWHRLGRLWRMPLVGELVQALTTPRGFAHEMRRGSRRLSRAQIEKTYAAIGPGTRRMILRWYRAMDPRHFAGWDDQLRVLAARVPSLVIWGEHDPYIDRRFAERFGAQGIEYAPDSGHWLPAEEPALVADRLRRFCAAAQSADPLSMR